MGPRRRSGGCAPLRPGPSPLSAPTPGPGPPASRLQALVLAPWPPACPRVLPWPSRLVPGALPAVPRWKAGSSLPGRCAAGAQHLSECPASRISDLTPLGSASPPGAQGSGAAPGCGGRRRMRSRGPRRGQVLAQREPCSRGAGKLTRNNLGAAFWGGRGQGGDGQPRCHLGGQDLTVVVPPPPSPGLAAAPAAPATPQPPRGRQGGFSQLLHAAGGGCLLGGETRYPAPRLGERSGEAGPTPCGQGWRWGPPPARCRGAGPRHLPSAEPLSPALPAREPCRRGGCPAAAAPTLTLGAAAPPERVPGSLLVSVARCRCSGLTASPSPQRVASPGLEQHAENPPS
ncbi:uncharacterized protein [Ciconia boyciana]|uniref:uncharacterized protein isoform X2 n=1 Tax=Ciconia boyciana TaxID=52775 RepID=UPI003BA0428C